MDSLAAQQALRSDRELLRRYREFRDEPAVTELITRHAALVRGVCQRLLGNSADADDAFQATFVVLIRKGEVLRVDGSLAGWLYAVASRIARRLRQERSRAIALLQEGDAVTETDPLSELATRHDVAVFETELARLPEKYRTPIVLHHLEGKSQRDVALELRVTEGAVDGRLKRGRNELRARLARRGIVFGVTIAVLQQTQGAMAATTLGPLIDATCRNILSLDPVQNSAVPPTTATHLARQEIHSMGLQQFTKAAAWTLLAGLLVGAAGLAISSERGELPLREVHGKMAEQQPRQPADETVVALAGDPDKPPGAAAQPEKPAAKPGEVEDRKRKLNALLEQKLELMREGVAVATKEFQFARIEVQEVINWHMDLHRAELDVCTNDRERIAVWTQALESAKEFETMVRAKRTMAQASGSELMRAMAYRLDVEIALERLNSKTAEGM